MPKRWIVCWCVVFLLAAQIASSAGGADRAVPGAAPIAVSPATAAGVARVESRCPTFLWGAVESAESYELLVYESTEDAVGQDSSRGRVVLLKEFPGSVHGWVPTSGDCLERGGLYGWTVRAVFPDGASEWSDPSVFDIAATLSSAEARELLLALRRQATEDPAATEVAAAVGAYLGLPAASPVGNGGTARSAAEAETARAAPELWVTVPAEAFHGEGVRTESQWSCPYLGCEWWAPLDVPHGSRIVGLELEGCDAHDETNLALRLTQVSPFTGVGTELGNVFLDSSGTPGCGYWRSPLPTPHVADQLLGSYQLSVRITHCISGCGSPGTSVSFTGARVYYQPNPDGVVQPTAGADPPRFP